MKKKKFYRVANIETNQGLWYNIDGKFTGLIHSEFNFCKNNNLPMPFDEEIQGYLSATDTLQDLFNWFPEEDIVKLEEYGYFVTIYESNDYRKYHNHWIINSDSARILERIEFSPVM